MRVLYKRDQKAGSGAAYCIYIAAGGDSWKDMVPQATGTAVEHLDLRNRMLRLLQPDVASGQLAKSSDRQPGAL